jgi:hypothetical protein
MSQDMPASKGPRQVAYFGPVLDALRTLGGEARPADVKEMIAKTLQISQEEQAETLDSGQPRFSNQVDWARFHLSQEGYIDKSRRGIWALTEKGRAARLTPEDALRIWKEHVAAYRRRRGASNGSEDADDDEALPDLLRAEDEEHPLRYRIAGVERRIDVLVQAKDEERSLGYTSDPPNVGQGPDVASAAGVSDEPPSVDVRNSEPATGAAKAAPAEEIDPWDEEIDLGKLQQDWSKEGEGEQDNRYIIGRDNRVDGEPKTQTGPELAQLHAELALFRDQVTEIRAELTQLRAFLTEPRVEPRMEPSQELTELRAELAQLRNELAGRVAAELQRFTLETQDRERVREERLAAEGQQMVEHALARQREAEHAREEKRREPSGRWKARGLVALLAVLSATRRLLQIARGLSRRLSGRRGTRLRTVYVSIRWHLRRADRILWRLSKALEQRRARATPCRP